MSSHKLQSAVELIVWKPQPNRNNKKRVGRGGGKGGGRGGWKETRFETPLSIAKKENQPHAVTFPQLPGDCREQSPPKIQFHRRFFFFFFLTVKQWGLHSGGRLYSPSHRPISQQVQHGIRPRYRATSTWNTDAGPWRRGKTDRCHNNPSLGD